MYAVIQTGGKQYRVEVGTELEIERLEAGPGESVAFDHVLLVADGDAASIGRPLVANASVAAQVVRRERGEKLISFKYRPKARRRVKKGHRQELTVVRISDIVVDGKSAAGDLAEAEERRKTERERLEEGARRQAAKDAELAAKLAAEKPAKSAKADAAETKTAPKRASSAKAVTKATAETAKTPSTKPATADTTEKGATKTKATAKGSTTAAKLTAAKPAAPKPASKTSAPKTPRVRKSGED